ncbi:MAG: hypothetical protein CVU00_11455 [Bacteroidetes bacterium HGW-Bacteroidetes-17]|nr:MAG: hypothetical protein CVU00_11455 [Bacteroidetes bacterium HGW-Bacteroidetes-17]
MDIRFDENILKMEALYHHKIGDSSDSLFFILNPDVDSLKIQGVNLNNFLIHEKQNRPFPYLKLNFNRVLIKGEIIDLHFSYQIDLVKQNHLNSDWIELNLDKFWFPNHNDIDNKFTYELNIAGLPSDFTLISHIDADIKIDNSNKILIQKRSPDIEVLILAGKDMRNWKADSSSQITFIASKHTPDSLLHSMHEKVFQSIKFMNESFGKSNPIKEFKVVLRNTTKKEIGFQFARKNMIITASDFNSYGNLSHEIAHFWWFDADFIKEPWMNESFANYSMFLVLEQYDPSTFTEIFNKYKELSFDAPAVDQATLFSDDAYNSYYIKGSILLKRLELIIGKSKMNELLELRITKRINNTEKLLNELEILTDLTTRNLFKRMLLE